MNSSDGDKDLRFILLLVPRTIPRLLPRTFLREKPRIVPRALPNALPNALTALIFGHLFRLSAFAHFVCTENMFTALCFRKT